MTQKFFMIVLLTGMLSLLTACQSSPQKSYYLLTPQLPQAEKKAESIDKLIGLGPVSLADYLDRPNMVRMYADNQLNLNSNDYWGEPLDKGIVRVLSLNLTRQDPSRMIQAFPWRSDRIPPYSLRLSIHELVQSQGQARINSTWELVDTRNNASITRQHFVESLDTNNKADSMAYAYSRLFANMAREMNAALLKVEQKK